MPESRVTPTCPPLLFLVLFCYYRIILMLHVLLDRYGPLPINLAVGVATRVLVPQEVSSLALLVPPLSS